MLTSLSLIKIRKENINEGKRAEERGEGTTEGIGRFLRNRPAGGAREEIRGKSETRRMKGDEGKPVEKIRSTEARILFRIKF